jgi:hypothetical protein
MSTSTSLITNHPPLAHDAQGCKVAVPPGTKYWRILRFTAGRPKTMPGRFDLDLTPEQLVELCGPGRYRIDALDEFGQPLATDLATIIVGGSGDATAIESGASPNVRAVPAPSDTRFMLETLAQMSRAHSESLQSLSTAQADWIKTLATAKQLPRNAAPTPPASMSPEPDAPEPWWVHLLKPQALMAVSGLLRNLGSWFGVKPESSEPPKRRNASALAQMAERTTSSLSAEQALDLMFGKAKVEPDAAQPSPTEKSS